MNKINRSIPGIVGMLLVAIIACAAYLLRQRSIGSPQDGIAGVDISAPISPDAQAAVEGVAAFYTIDYTETTEQWAVRLCEHLATEIDCKVAKVYLAPAVFATAQKYKVQTNCTVFPIRLVSDEIKDGIQIRIWELQVTLDHPWPGAASPMVVYADAAFDPAARKWSMRHILFEQEVQVLQLGAP